MTEVDIQTCIKNNFAPCDGLSFFFPRPVYKCFDLALWNVCFIHRVGLPLICVAPVFPLFLVGGWVGGGRWICFLPWHLVLNNHFIHMSQTNRHWPLLLSLLFYLFLATGPQQKQPDPGGKKQVLQPTARREDLHQRILRRPQHLRRLLTLDSAAQTRGGHQPHHPFRLYSFLCALYWDSWHHAWGSPTLRLYGSWYVMKTQTHVVANRGKPTFSQVPWGPIGKLFFFRGGGGGKSRPLPLADKRTAGFPNMDKEGKIKTLIWLWENVIPF